MLGVTRATTAHLALLDGFALVVHGHPADSGMSLSTQRLLARISTSRQPSRTAVANALFPDLDEQQAQGRLRSALWRLQRAAPGLVEPVGGSLRLSAGVRVDVQELTTWAQGVLASPSGQVRGAPPQALAGDLLPGWYDDWVLQERAQLRQLRHHALEVLVDRLAAEGRYGEALQAGYAVLSSDPLRESARRAVIRVHLAEGNVAEAIHEGEQFRRLLHDELGVAPTSRLDELLRDVLPAQRHRRR